MRKHFNNTQVSQGNELAWGNRDPIEIIYVILLTCEKGALKTHIMYRSNLNTKQVQNYLDLLLDRHLIEKKPDPESPRYIYMTTPQGETCVRTYNELLKILS